MSHKEEDEAQLLWEENQSWGLSNSDYNSPESQHQAISIPPSHKNNNDNNNNNNDLKEGDEEEEGGNMMEGGDNKTALSSKKRSRGGGKRRRGSNGESEEHEVHIWTERERRKKMRNMFSSLHALLPHLPPKADKSTIVDEAVTYIQSLQNTLKKLQIQKLERLQQLNSQSQYHPYGSSSREAFMADQGSSMNHSNNSNNNNASINVGPSNPSTSVSVPRINNNSNNPTGFQTWSCPNMVLNICGDEAQFSVCCPKKPGLFTSVCYVLQKYKIEVLSAQVSSDNYRSMFMIQTQANRASNQFPEAFSVEDRFKQAASEIIRWLP